MSRHLADDPPKATCAPASSPMCRLEYTCMDIIKNYAQYLISVIKPLLLGCKEIEFQKPVFMNITSEEHSTFHKGSIPLRIADATEVFSKPDMTDFGLEQVIDSNNYLV